jgi:hypothetical protein
MPGKRRFRVAGLRYATGRTRRRRGLSRFDVARFGAGAVLEGCNLSFTLRLDGFVFYWAPQKTATSDKALFKLNVLACLQNNISHVPASAGASIRMDVPVDVCRSGGIRAGQFGHQARAAGFRSECTGNKRARSGERAGTTQRYG